jgi:hypothetical protein
MMIDLALLMTGHQNERRSVAHNCEIHKNFM